MSSIASFKPTARAQGAKWEEEACTFLEAKGLRTITRNYQCRQGEIDLVMQDKEHLVFVEVRYRTHPYYGSGVESITFRKQQRIIKTAQYFLYTHQAFMKLACRFDVITVAQTKLGVQIDWIPHAFEAQY